MSPCVQVRRKASPRELAEAFKGHGLRQATWAPVPIFWARSVEEPSIHPPQLPALPAAATMEQVWIVFASALPSFLSMCHQ